MQALKETQFEFPGVTSRYKGKVRDVYYLDQLMVVVASDRISAFDVILPRAIPYKGQILNQIAAKFLALTKNIVPNWVQAVPDPNVTIGVKCEPFKVEMVIRGYLAGHAWREYRAGKRQVCGVTLPEGLKENDKLPSPIITPTTKASHGHDMDISREEIIGQGIVPEADYVKLEQYTRALYEKGAAYARSQGLILVDTKYEFGSHDGTIYLIDEIHTPDSSRYFYADTYEAIQAKGEPQKQLSKEFVRQWLIENGFQGHDGQKIPEMTDEVVNSISDRYIELFEKVAGEKFNKRSYSGIEATIEKNVLSSLKELSK